MIEEEEGETLTAEEKQAMRILAASPTKFCSALLNFTPFPYQVKMLEDPSRNIIVCAARRVGKSLIMAYKALWFAFAHPKTSTLIVASTQRQSMLMFDKLLEHLAQSPLLQESVVRQTRTLITLSNASRIVALPCGKTGKTIRGENADLIIIDEAAFVPEDVILSVMMPMLATTHGKMIMLSTPWDKNHFFYKAFQSPYWSKYRFKTEDNPLVEKEYLQMQLEMLGERRFRQEYLAEFVDDLRTFFPMKLLRPCIHVCADRSGDVSCSFCDSNSEKKLATGDLYAGYDPGGMTDPAALVVVQKVKQDGEESETPAFRVVLIKTFLTEQKRKGEEGEVYAQFNLQIADLHKKAPFKKLTMDTTGIGAPIASHCRDLGLPVEGQTIHRKIQEEIFSNLNLLLQREKIELPDNMDLLSSLNCIEAERDRIGGYSFSHPRGTHDDLAYALALAVWKAGKGQSTVIMNVSNQPPKADWRRSSGQEENY